MKRAALLAVLLIGASAFAARPASPFVVGVEQSTKAQWQAFASQFESQVGVPVSIEPYPQNSIAQQVVLQAFTRSGRLHFVMIQDSWGASLSKYFTDLGSAEAQLREQGIEPRIVGGRAVGVPISFANGWFLAVLAWPDDRAIATQFLIAVGGGKASATLTGPVPPQLPVSVSNAPGKIASAEHNPRLDGSLESLIAAAQTAVQAMAATALSSLPAQARTALDGVAKRLGVPFSADTATVTVVLESRPGRSGASNVAALSALGVRGPSVQASSSLIKVSVPIAQLGTLAAQLTGVAFIRPPYTPYVLGTPTEGTAAIGATAFHTAGIRGAGVKVAVIDLGFYGMSAARSRGDLPPALVANDLTGTGIESGISHGTAVAEIVYDIAPDAQIYLIKIADEVDLDLAVTYCLEQGIDIINHSLGWYNTNYYDGTGTVADIARRAIQGGILWVNAAGNEAQSHWEGTFTDGNSDGWHDQDLSFYSSSGSPIILYLTWNEWPQSGTDYDLYLYDPSGGLAASSNKNQTGTEEPTESIQVTASASGTYRVRFQGTGSRSLEIYNLYQGLTPYVAASSILAPADVAEVVTVGAIAYTSYTTGPQEPYSSQGPTNDGRTKPDLACPDNVTTGTSPYMSFPGTSGAAPHAAGAAALLLSQQPTLSAAALRSLLLGNTIAMGSPNIYGQGRLFLQPPAAGNQPPTAAFTFSPASPTIGAAVSFNGGSSSDPDGTIVAYAWTFGDGATGSGVSPAHAYAAVGSYTVRLTVTDNRGATGTTTRVVTVGATPNQPPVATFTYAPTNPSPGAPVTFNASASYDPDGSIVTYSWSYGDGGSGSGVATSHAYGGPGTYNVTLTVRDAVGATSSTTQPVAVQVGAAPDLVVTSLAYSPSSPLLGQSTTFTLTIANQGNAPAGSFRVLLDGSVSSTNAYVSQLEAGGTRSMTLVLPLTISPQTFTVRVDDLGQIAESNESNNSRSVTVTAGTQTPTAEAGGPYAGVVGAAISFNGSGSSGSITTYVWAFGDGTSGQGVSVTHAYTSPGTYTATLTVLGPGGQSSDAATVSVIAAQLPLSVQVSASKSAYQVGENVAFTLTSNRTAYLYLCEVRADQRVLLLYPNRYQSSNRVGPGSVVVPGSGYSIRASEPTGTETLYLFAATAPIPGFPTAFGSDFPILSNSPDAFRNSVLAAMQSVAGTGDWAYDTRSFTIVAAPSAAGRLRVVTKPSGASVLLDGASIGSTPLERANVPAGIHTVQISAPGYQTETRQVTTQAGITTTLQVTLTPLPSIQPPAVAPRNQPPTASLAVAPASPVVGEPALFDASASADSDGTITSYAWDFGDGTSGSGRTASHTYGTSGTFSVLLTITDNGGLSSSTSRAVSVSEPSAWVLPVVSADSSPGWQNPGRACDGDPETSAQYDILRGTTSQYIVLAASGGRLLCDGIRFRVTNPDPSYGATVQPWIGTEPSPPALLWQVDVLYDNGEWITVYRDIPSRNQWIEVRFAEREVVQVRLRAQNNQRTGLVPMLLEVNLRDASIT